MGEPMAKKSGSLNLTDGPGRSSWPLPAPLPPPAGGQRVYSVSEITRAIKGTVESEFPDVWVRGELANFKLHSSGHVFHSMKDGVALIECIIFRYAERKALFKDDLEDGMEVVAHGKIDLYERRGQYRLIIDFVQPVGVGALLLQFEKMKRKLLEEGLFDPSRKRPLPALPQRIGVVTSPTGAAIRDILTVLRRRFANVHVLIYPVRVQGEGAAREIASAIDEMNRLSDADVLIVGRGGGSLEDLWAFNEEAVARAIHRSKIPVISAVGHEIDTTIADLVADVRAPTPSAAAEMVLRSKVELLEKVGGLNIRLFRALRGLLSSQEARLREAARVLASPQRRIEDYMMRLDDAFTRLENAVDWMSTRREAQLKEFQRALLLLSPRNRLRQAGTTLLHLGQRLATAQGSALETHRRRLEQKRALLDSLSPLSILKRGYAIPYCLPQRTILREAKAARKGQTIEVRLSDGELTCEVIRDPRQVKLV